METINNDEVWKEIIGYEGIYSVSSHGRIRRDVGYKGLCKTGRILKASTNNWGYLTIGLHAYKKRKTFRVNRLVAINFINIDHTGLEVNHKDGNKLNNHISNLEFVTSSENQKHSYRLGNRKKNNSRGESIGTAKLKKKEILFIRKLYAKGGMSQQKIANMFNVTQTTIGLIVRKLRWGWLK